MSSHGNSAFAVANMTSCHIPAAPRAELLNCAIDRPLTSLRSIGVSTASVRASHQLTIGLSLAGSREVDFIAAGNDFRPVAILDTLQNSQ
jgi:hypothetical protein